MALLKYLKLDPKRLPHPSGPLSTIVPASSIAAANEEVKEIVKEENKKERDPCGRSAEYRLVPIILQVIVPPRRKMKNKSIIFVWTRRLWLLHPVPLLLQIYPPDYSILTCREVLPL